MKEFCSVKPVTPVPSIPLPLVFWVPIRVKDGFSVFVSDTPWLVVFWIAPPVQLARLLQVPPLPVTMKRPDEPVLFSTIPFDAPLAEMLWNVSPLAPMVVLATFSAVPVS